MDERDPEFLSALFEALLFAADEPLTIEQIHRVVEGEFQLDELTRRFETFRELKNAQDAGTKIVEIAGGFLFRTNPYLDPWIRRFKTKVRPVRLSHAALDTLAIVAYRQPISTPEIDAIRGISCAGVMKTLLEKGLISILGRKDVPGRPLVYGTSKRFLEEFNLNNLTDLPNLKEMEDILKSRDNPELPPTTEV